MRLLRHALVLLAAAVSAYADSIVSSTFDTDADGWTAGQFLTTAGPIAAPTYVSSGGNPGGYLHVDDFVDWTAYHAPAKFLGNQSAWSGHALTFDIRASGTDGVMYSAVIISNGTITLQYRGLPTAGIWYNFHIPLIGSAGWQHSTDGRVPGAAATNADLQAVLSNIQFLHIDADWMTGMDSGELDNVQVIYNPEPSTMLLFSSAFAVLVAVGRKRALKRAARRSC